MIRFLVTFSIVSVVLVMAGFTGFYGEMKAGNIQIQGLNFVLSTKATLAAVAFAAGSIGLFFLGIVADGMRR